jgi:hypothetical protein
MAALIAVAAAVGFAPKQASAQTLVTCESTNGNRQVCPANTAGGVAIRAQISAVNCVEGQNWGYTRNAIWVSNGCRGQFRVGAGNGYGTNNGNNNNGNYNNNRSVNNAAALCQRAVRAQLGRRTNVSTWNVNNSRNNSRVGWRAANGRAGECRVDRNGNVSVQVNRGR